VNGVIAKFFRLDATGHNLDLQFAVRGDNDLCGIAIDEGLCYLVQNLNTKISDLRHINLEVSNGVVDLLCSQLRQANNVTRLWHIHKGKPGIDTVVVRTPDIGLTVAAALDIPHARQNLTSIRTALVNQRYVLLNLSMVGKLFTQENRSRLLAH
jgi:hypothetical protein